MAGHVTAGLAFIGIGLVGLVVSVYRRRARGRDFDARFRARLEHHLGAPVPNRGWEHWAARISGLSDAIGPALALIVGMVLVIGSDLGEPADRVIFAFVLLLGLWLLWARRWNTATTLAGLDLSPPRSRQLFGAEPAVVERWYLLSGLAATLAGAIGLVT